MQLPVEIESTLCRKKGEAIFYRKFSICSSHMRFPNEQFGWVGINANKGIYILYNSDWLGDSMAMRKQGTSLQWLAQTV